MKRKLELVKLILETVEEFPHSIFRGNIKIENFTDEEIEYHIHLMGQAGLVTAANQTTSGSKSHKARVSALTWEGHEFLDNARNGKAWERLKSMSNLSFEVAKTLLAEAAKQVTLITLSS